MKKITHLAFMLTFFTFFVGWSQNTSEPPDFPGTGSGPAINLLVGANTVSGSLATPADGQDRFQVVAPTGTQIDAINFTYNTAGGSSATMTFNSSVVVSSPGGSVSGTPYAAGTYTVLIASGFAISNNWSMSFTVSAVAGCDISIGSVNTAPPSCPGGSDGSITVNATCTTCTAIEYSLDNATFQASNVFIRPAGPYTVFVRDTGDGSCNASAAATVAAGTDTTAPMITCPGNQTGNVDTACLFTVPDYTGLATTTDNCTTPTITQNPAPGTMVGLGAITITLTANDGNGQTTDCIFTLTVEDNIAPVITCVADTARDTDAGVCTYTVVGAEFDAMFTDNCMSATITNDFNGTATVAGEIFPLGDTVLTWTVDDGNGQTAMCTTTVTVTDNEAPMITCVADAPRDTDAGVCTYTVVGTEFDATFTDNCMSATITNDFNGTATVAGEVFPLGDTVLTWTVDDGNGQTAMCTTTVTVADNEAPVITCVADAPRDTDAGVCTYTVQGTEFDATFTDNCTSATITNDFNGTATVAGEVFPLGDTVLTWTVDDGNGQTAMCTTTVTVEDNEVPTASCAAPFSIQLDDMGMASITVADIDNGSSDNCGVASVTIDRTSFDCSDIESDFALDLSGGVGVGIATDANATIPTGNAARTLSVRINPTSITSTIGGIMHQGNNDCTGRMFGMGSSNTGQMTFWGGCNDYTSNLMITPGVWQTLTLVYDGAGTVTLYKDALSENYASGALITEAGRLFVGVESINNGASYRNFFDGQYSDVKVFDRALTPAEVMMLASGDVVAAGNLVLDIPIDEGSGTALADVAGSNNATAFGTDDSDWVEIAQSQSVTLTVTDVNGNMSTCTTQVTVEDNIAPVITCVADAPRDTDAGVCTYTVQGTEFDATFTDNCPSATITNDFNGTATVAGEVFPLGDTVLTWTVDDGNGQTAMCTTTVTVEDNEAPVITCVGDAPRDTDAGVCTYTVVGTEFDATFTDNCMSATITNDFNGTATVAGEVFPLGDTVLTWTVDDGNGQTAMCTTTVTVEDNEAPVITCVADAPRDTDAGVCTYTVVGTEFDATFTDNCMSATITNDFNGTATVAGEVFPLGDTVLTWTVDDGNGQTAMCTTTVTVEDNEDPTFMCVAPFELMLDQDGMASITPVDIVGGTLTLTTISGDNGSGGAGSTDFTVPVTTDETVSFDWSYTTNDGATFDNFGYSIDGVYTQLTNNGGGNNQSGSATVVLTAGQVFGFVSNTIDNIFGASTTTVSNFMPGFTGQFAEDNWTLTLTNSDGDAFFTADPNITDNCGVDSFSLDVSDFTCADLGDNVVTITVTDVNGNVAMCSTTVTIVDTPILITSGPVDIFTGTGTNAGDCSAIVNYDPVTIDSFTFESNCTDPASVTVAQTGGLGSGAMFPVGTTTEEYTLTDANGGEVVYTFDVTITDTTLPVIDCPDDIIVSGDDSGNYTIEDYTGLASDNCSSGADLVVIQDPVAGTLVTDPSTTTITLTAIDAAGNEQTCSFELIVDETLSIGDEALQNIGVAMYPNPASSQVTLDAGIHTIDTVTIYDLAGRVVVKEAVRAAAHQLDVSNFSTAVYLVQIQSGDTIITKRLIKE